MRAHYDSWYTEETFAALAARKIKMIRVPIGDWTLNPYGPYKGCMDGAKEKIDWLYDMAAKYGLKVLLDVHAMKGSQNGFDNSGTTNRVTWVDDQHFSHWPDSVGEWQGEWDSAAQKYTYINQDNIQWSLAQAEAFMKRWGTHKAFYAYEPVNEPWWLSDMDTLFKFYRDVRKLLQVHAPQAIFCFHDAFQYNADLWNSLFADGDTDKVVLDHHYYQAWNTGMTTTDQFCDDYEKNAAYADAFKYPVWFGEWALATDICAHWLGGFNDGNTKPQFQCQWVDCPVTYLPTSVAVDFNRTAYILGPFGTGNANDVCIQNGKCSSDSAYFSDAQVNTLAKCAYKSFDAHLGAHIMWTAHNEIEIKWDYIRAYDKGWLQTE
jgi:glucan 1,3-beta-glucosidase